MLTIMIHCLLAILLILQIVMIVYMLITNIKQAKRDKKFWAEMDEAMRKSITKYNDLCQDEVLKLEEEHKSEQDQ